MTIKKDSFDFQIIINDEFIKSIEYLSKTLNQTLGSFGESLKKQWVEFSDKAPKVQNYFNCSGWYCFCQDIDLPTIIYIGEMIDSGQSDNAERIIQEFARGQIDKTLIQVKEYLPERFNILKDAFEAHKKGLYTLSIPTLLAQADGICYEILNVSLFGKKSKNPQTKEALEIVLKNNKKLGNTIHLNGITNQFIDPLMTITSISVNTKDRDKQRGVNPLYGPLNRHGVLHGIDINYATESNSLRAIMIINYLIDIKMIIKE